MHLFAGGGGGLLADLILGHTPIVAVEWDKYACEILRARRDDGWFEGLHVWEGDVRLFDPSEYEGTVDCIHAGFPCQDLSQAGKQAGLGEGTRSGLYREVLRIAGLVRPKFLFMENVSAILSNGLGTVLADLATMGYDAKWCCIRASDVGAPHQRDRWWLKATMGDTKSEQRNGGDNNGINCVGESISKSRNTSCKKAELANSDSIGHIHSETKFNTTEGREYAQCDIATGCDDVAYTDIKSKFGLSVREKKKVASAGINCKNEGFSDTTSFRLQGQREQPNSIGKTQERQRQANYAESDNATWWEVESNVGRVANGVADWSHRLKALGNGQVPLQCALAWELLS